MVGEDGGTTICAFVLMDKANKSVANMPNNPMHLMSPLQGRQRLFLTIESPLLNLLVIVLL